MARLTYCFVVVAALVAMSAAFPPRYNWQYTSQYPRIFQAACLVKNTLTGQELQNEECKCGDQTAACDIGPITHYNVEMTFCNKLDDQTIDDLYIMQFACKGGVDQNCGVGTLCDIGPVTVEGVEYFLCRFAASIDADSTAEMCKPNVTFTQPPAWGQGYGTFGGWGGYGGYRRNGGRRWQTSGSFPFNPQQNFPFNPQPNVPVNPQQNVPFNPQPNVPVNPQQNVPFNPQQNVPFNPQQNVPVNPQQNPGMMGGAWMGGQRGQGRRGGYFNW